jgi:putative membrane protein insertion efficiency factor
MAANKSSESVYTKWEKKQYKIGSWYRQNPVAARLLKPVWFQPVMGTCRFVPSCSQYAEQVFADWGFWRGGWLTLKRLVRCHPFSQTPVGTVDYPPL